MPHLRRALTRATVIATAALTTAAIAVAPASADPNFGAGNLGPMEIVEGGELDYGVSLSPCPAGYECNLVMHDSSGWAIKDVDYRHWVRGRIFKPSDGRMIDVATIKTIDDTLVERDEPLFINARVEYYPGG